MSIESMKGLTITKIDRDGDESICFHTDGGRFLMHHEQICCESVRIEDVCGDLNDLVGSPLLMAESVTNSDVPPKDRDQESWTWTFYKMATEKGYVTMRWYGFSTGYYSEEVSVEKLDDPPRIDVAGNPIENYIDAKILHKRYTRSELDTE